MSRVVKTKAARNDLKQVGRYIERESGDRVAAVQYLRELDHRLELLATQPRMGPSRDDLMPGLRYQPFDSYLIFYKPIVDGIEVLRVVHAARDVAGMFH